MQKSAINFSIYYEDIRGSCTEPVLIYSERLVPENRWHYHNSIELIYVRSGRVGMTAEQEKQMIISAGEVFVLDELIIHRTSYTEDGEYYVMLIPIDKVREFIAMRGDRCFGSNKFSDKNGYIFSLVSELYNINSRMAEADMPKYQLFLLNTLLSGIFMRTGGKSRSERLSFELYPILEYIHNHIGEKFTIKELAAHFGYTPRGLSEFFDRISLDYSLKEYISRLRISRAKQLLCAGVSYEEAADKSGYGCIRSFYNAFERIEHMTPNEYLESMKANDSN